MENLISPLLDDLEMRRFYTMARLEPDLSPAEGESEALTSLAVSMKRIADAMDSSAYRGPPRERRFEALKVKLVNLMGPKKFSLCEAIDKAERFLLKHF